MPYNNRSLVSHSSEGPSPQSKVSAGPCPFWDSGENSPWVFLNSGGDCQSLAFLDLSLHEWLQSLPLPSHGVFPVCLCFCLVSSHKDISYLGVGHTLIHWDPILTWLHLQRPCFQMKSHALILEVRTSTYLGGNTIQLTRVILLLTSLWTLRFHSSYSGANGLIYFKWMLGYDIPNYFLQRKCIKGIKEWRLCS